MRWSLVFSLVIVLLLLTAALTTISLINTVAAHSTGDIVLMECQIKGTVGPPRPIEIVSYDNSSGTPSAPADLTNCAQTLADIGNVSLEIRDIQITDFGGSSLLFTLTVDPLSAIPSPVQSIPSITLWGLVALTLLLAGLGYLRLRRASRYIANHSIT